MGRPRSNELARGGHTSLGEHDRANNADTPPQQDDSPIGPVPPGNQPGHRPDDDPGKPVEAFAARFPVPGPDNAGPDNAGPDEDFPAVGRQPTNRDHAPEHSPSVPARPGAVSHEAETVPATVAGVLRLGSGFAAAERSALVGQLSGMDPRLATYPAGQTKLELSVKERAQTTQAVTLQCWIAGRPRLVATSSQPALAAALTEVRDDLRRQLNDAKARTEPRNNRQLRGTPPPPRITFDVPGATA